jgi:hypothetical protein
MLRNNAPSRGGVNSRESDSRNNRRMSVVTAATYNYGEDGDEGQLAAKIQALQTYVTLYDKVKTENTMMREEMKKRDQDHVQITSYLQKDVELKSKQIKTLQKRLDDIQDEYEDKLKMKDLELHSRRSDFEKQQANKMSQIKDMQRDLGELELLKKDKKELLDTIKHKDDEILKLKTHFDSEITRLKVQFYEEKVNLKKEEEMLRKVLQEEIQSKAMSLVGKKSKEIHVENKELRDQQQIFEKDLIEVGAAKEQLEIDNKNLIREKKLLEENLKSYAKQSIKFTKEIRELNTKIETLETALTVTSEKNEREKLEAQRKYSSDLMEANKKNEEIQNLLRSRTKELVHLKKIAERILHQRTQLEMFFTEAFGYVKQQRLKEIKEEEQSTTFPYSFHNPDAFPGREFPPIYSNNNNKLSKRKSQQQRRSPSVTNNTNSSFLNSSSLEELSGDFGSLSWEDKEKVLKMLFQKINGTVVQTTRKSQQKEELRISDFAKVTKPPGMKDESNTPPLMNTPHIFTKQPDLTFITKLEDDEDGIL